MFLGVGTLDVVLVLPPILRVLGIDAERGLLTHAALPWALMVGLALFFLVCLGVVALARVHPVARGTMVGLVLLALGHFATAAAASPATPTGSQLLARLLLALPLVGACAWILSSRYRAACRAFRVESCGSPHEPRSR